MKITIGNKIKQLRKEKNITQEQLAAALNISFQAISKWETNIATPEISMIPKLANYFKVSIDDLFDYNLKEIEIKITAVCDEAYKYRASDPAAAKKILTDALADYPDNDILLNNLLYVTGDVDETIQIANKLILTTNDDSVKYDSLRFLAYAYQKKGDIDTAIAAIEQIPELYFTKLGELAFIYEGEKKYEAAEKQFWISFEQVLQMCCKLYEVDHSEQWLHQALDFIDILKFQPKIYNFENYKEYFKKLLGTTVAFGKAPQNFENKNK